MKWFHYGVIAVIASLLLTFLGGEFQGIGAVRWSPSKSTDLPLLEENTLLREGVERLFENAMLGPESLAVHPVTGTVFTGLMDGRIVSFEVEASSVEGAQPQKTSPTHFQTVAWLNEGCRDRLESNQNSPNQQPQWPWKQVVTTSYNDYPEELEELCGRPLGLRFDEQGSLFVLDAYKGLLLFPFPLEGQQQNDTPQPVTLYSSAHLANDLDLDGPFVYFTDSSDRYGRNKIILEFLSGRPSGKVMLHNRETGVTSVLLDGLPLTNGLTLSHDKQLVYFVAGADIYSLDRRTNDTFVALENLPCFPDNIRRHPTDQNTYLVCCGTKRARPFSLQDFLAPYPWMRELIAIMFSQQTILALTPKHSMVLQVELAAQKSSSGRVISSIQDPGALSVAWPSEAEKVGDYLYLGSWHEPYLARIPWNATPFSRG